MNMHGKQTALSLAIGSAFAASLAAIPTAEAGENPFGMQALKQGYMVAAADTGKDAKAKADTGQATKAKEGKCGDTSANSKDNMKATDKKMPEGKCGEGKCGGRKTEKK
jgi:uncharacterized low-complexity protein